MIDFPGFRQRFVLFGAVASLLVIVSFFFSDDLRSLRDINWHRFFRIFINRFNDHILSRDSGENRCAVLQFGALGSKLELGSKCEGIRLSKPRERRESFFNYV